MIAHLVALALSAQQTIYFQQSPAQKAALSDLLAKQQDPSSPLYHKWLSPEEFAQRFGASQSEYDQVAGWLKSQGYAIATRSRSRRWITVRAGAKPKFPATLAARVSGIRGLDRPRLQPRYRQRPRFNFLDGTHGMSPDDFATIYNVNPLYRSGIDGTGQKIAIVGQSAIQISDFERFRAKFNLPSQTVQQVLVPGSPNPGIVAGDVVEANLDLQWAGAVARKATLVYVYSDDVITSIEYAIDQNLAPILSSSYGACEARDLIDLPSMQANAQQANAQGITFLAPGGDAGAADCEDFSATIAQTGLAVDAPASIPEVTGVGGTQFSDGNYWAPTNDANFASALGYVPEVGWSSTGIFVPELSGGGGGTSILFAKPVWQTGRGVPAGSLRHVPDISLNASDVTPVLVVSEGQENYYYGTSLSAPTFAGILAMLNQHLAGKGLGNINPALYRLAEAQPAIFHDITEGGNTVPCATGSPDCVNGKLGFAAGPGYDRATGLGSVDADRFVRLFSSSPAQVSMVVPSIDQIPVYQPWQFVITLNESTGIATRLTGFTIDGQASNLAAAFGTGAIPARGFLTSNKIALQQVAVPKNVVFGFTGMDTGGRTWSQEFSVPFRGLEIPISISGAGNAASGQQAYAPGMIVSVYGDQMGSSPVAATALPLPFLLSGFQAFFDDVPAPVYYASPDQVNIQIPYETAPGRSKLIIGNPYQIASINLNISASAPGIFAANGFTVPFASASRGQTTTIFITGEGQVQPALATGATPDPATPVTSLPRPQLPATMTIGGVPTTIAFIGIPSGLAGVTQINFTVPANAPLGVQPVVVTVGSASSTPVSIRISE